MRIENSRILGGVGALLMFIGVFPYVNYFGIVGLIGLILIMLALYSLSNYYGERCIFNNALYGLITSIVGGVIAMVLIITTVIPSLIKIFHTIFPEWNGDWTALPKLELTPDVLNFSLEMFMPFLTGILATFITLWVFSMISAFFVRRSFRTLSVKSGVGLFSTAGLLLLIGAVLLIIFVGAILVWVSTLLLAVAFFQIKPQQAQPTTSTQM
ncbi:MAG: DUF996 domain-containing protein [Nitrososphaerota archaeon]|nr:DUF996 domain-containing protein [Aigarchaeota archaeon]MDW8076812.1 DUF996 domain-containing protein [Nitrososphaerota archaeon]